MKKFLFIFFLIVLSFSSIASEKLSLIILWHQHQPYYYNSQKDEFVLPWVRLHSIKDYYDMAKILNSFPKIELNMNLVPVLLKQIEMYVFDGKEDILMKIHKKHIEKLSIKEKRFLIEHCFDISWENVIEKFPEYKILLDKRKDILKKYSDDKKITASFTNQEYLDMQVWFNLAWCDPYFREYYPVVHNLINKKKNFSFKDLQKLLKFELKVMGEIIPLYRQLMERGQIDISTTPFYHPILPLLLNPKDAKIAMPDSSIPNIKSMKEEAIDEIMLAKEFYKKRFGTEPLGMWPAEGSVSDSALKAFAECGISWVATDEKILEKSIGQSIIRKNKKMLNPTKFCMPYVYEVHCEKHPEKCKKKIAIIFRDTYLSDKIGFDYSGISAKDAVDDFLSYLKGIYEKTKNSDKNYVVSVILDGENAWENYPEDGHEFFETLYSRISGEKWLKTVRISRYLSENWNSLPELKHIWPGSWINKDYSTWIGEDEENIAWKYAYECYKAYKENKDKIKPEDKKKAHDELLALLGSDWYWWYGKDQNSGMDEVYDSLFRIHLSNVYKYLGLKVPKRFFASILTPENNDSVIPPKALFTPIMDGKKDKLWDESAGRWLPFEGGVMQKTRPFNRFYFCFDKNNLYFGISDLSKSIDKIVFYGRNGKKQLLSTDDDFNFKTNTLFNIRFIIDIKNYTAEFFRRNDSGWEKIWSSSIKKDDFLECILPLKYFNSDSFIVFPTSIQGKMAKELTAKRLVIKWPPKEKEIAFFKDALGDDNGYGHTIYPKNKAFKKGSFDIKSLRITQTNDEYRFYISLGAIFNPWNSTSGFSVQTIDLYLCGKNGIMNMLPGRNAKIAHGGWKFCATIEGWKSKLFQAVKGNRKEICLLKPGLSFDGESIVFSIRKKIIGDIHKYKFVLAIMGQDGYSDENNMRVRTINKKADEWHFGGRKSKFDSNIIDILDPDGNQNKLLAPLNGTVSINTLSIN